jgi:hypothetical protein
VLCAANVQRVGIHIGANSGDESMTHRDLSLITSAVAALLIGISSAAIAQTVTPELIAPGAGLPGGSIGGLSPQNVPIAPGSAAPATEQIGPGGIRLAPSGTVGSAGAPLVTSPAEPRAPGRRVR